MKQLQIQIRQFRTVVYQLAQLFEVLQMTSSKELSIPDDKQKFLSSGEGHINTVDAV